jgi:protein-tyrosine phosphatase
MKTDGTNPPGQGTFGLVDINCHILPGIEDGPDNLKEAIDMLKIAYEEGIRTIVATPPYNKNNTLMDEDKLDRIIEQLNVEAGKIDSDYRIYLGREVEYNDENHQKIISGQLDSMADSKYVMIRFASDIDFETISEAIRDINMDGYIPIVADVEQYDCMEENEDKVEELIQLGAYIQISAASVIGDLGHDKKSFSRKLLKEELVHFVASDALDSEDKAPYLRECAEYIERKYGLDYKNELFYINPMAVIENSDIDI